MSRPEEYFESTDGWHFFQGKENIGTMLITKTGDMHYVHASFTRELDGPKITNYIRSLLWIAKSKR